MDAVGVDLHQGDDRGIRASLLVEHAREQRVARVDEVVAEEHGERLVADVHRGAQHRVAEALRVALAHEVDVGEVGWTAAPSLELGRVALLPRACARARRPRSKWFASAFLLRPMIMSTSWRPASTASSTTYWIAGLSTTGSISFGIALVAGRKRVPSPAAGMTAFVIRWVMAGSCEPRHRRGLTQAAVSAAA